MRYQNFHLVPPPDIVLSTSLIFEYRKKARWGFSILTLIFKRRGANHPEKKSGQKPCLPGRPGVKPNVVYGYGAWEPPPNEGWSGDRSPWLMR